MVEIQLQRFVDATVFRISNNLTSGPIDPTPSGKLLPPPPARGITRLRGGRI